MCVAKWEKMCLKKPNVIARGDKKGLFKEKGFKCQGRICNSLYLKKIKSIEFLQVCLFVKVVIKAKSTSNLPDFL